MTRTTATKTEQWLQLTWLLALGLIGGGLLIGLARGCDDDDGHIRPVFAATRPRAQYRLSGGMALPDPEITPGAVNREIEADRSGASRVVDGIETNICAPHFSATAIRKTIRNFAKLKKQACEEYGVAKCDNSVEGDHLISIELGGCPDCLANLWPQPMAEARIKDHQVEDVLPRLICSGRISLREAQKCVAGDWVECADRIKTLGEGSGGRKAGK
jgi:hypothetical protein